MCQYLLHVTECLQPPACDNLQTFYDALPVSIGRFFYNEIK